MDLKRLEKHIKLCKRNLNNKKIKCCAICPFEEQIISVYPELKRLFVTKQKKLSGDKNV
jgi:hypothetical protein